MFFAQIDFALAGRASEEIEVAVSSLLQVWRQNGQIIGHDGSLIRYSEGLRASQMLPTRTSLQTKNNNVYAKQGLARLKAMGVSRSKVTILGEEISRTPKSEVASHVAAKSEARLSCLRLRLKLNHPSLVVIALGPFRFVRLLISAAKNTSKSYAGNQRIRRLTR
jgi:hypothetical protein